MFIESEQSRQRLGSDLESRKRLQSVEPSAHTAATVVTDVISSDGTLIVKSETSHIVHVINKVGGEMC